ncbi:MAG: glycerol-3-phosphate 1-O-acyltransferase PlsY [Candidatus Omnitrophica bacterium]|nr:glycerol-3-phosphate 1-O-acyltransferase PlsY [Candidatus Omnitrophota bacterium]MCM8793874.1 glycerol-3-phosphate 1-O-acyltransferase PlsY [Candidatus Omnitrophota bacterium]
MFIIKIVLAFLVGSFPTGYIVTKIFRRTDIRREGSGNIGATNVWRVVGKIPGMLVLFVDIFKGYLVVKYFVSQGTLSFLSPFVESLVLGFFVVLGHTFSIFLKFRGGKGVATTAGVLFALEPRIFTICFFIWIFIFLFFRYVSLASILTAVSLPIILLILARPFFYILFAVLLALLISYKHLPNIRRLILAQEPKFHFR